MPGNICPLHGRKESPNDSVIGLPDGLSMRLKLHKGSYSGIRLPACAEGPASDAHKEATGVGNRGWKILVLAGVCAAAAASAVSVRAQSKDSFTPMPLDSGFGRMDVTPPAIPADQIIKEFAAKETEFQEALNHYTYRRVAKVDTIDDDTNKVDGEWYEVDDVIFDPIGRARWRRWFPRRPARLRGS